MAPWRRRREEPDPPEVPTGELAEVMHQAAVYAEELQTEFERHPRLHGLEVSVSSVREGRRTNVFLGPFLIRWPQPSRPEVLDHAELILTRPEQHQPWQQLLTADQARDRVRGVLERWAGA